MQTRITVLIMLGLVSQAFCQMVWRQMPDQSRYVWGVVSEDGVWAAEDCGTICHTPSNKRSTYNFMALVPNSSPIFTCVGFAGADALVYEDPFAPRRSLKVGVPSLITNTVTFTQTQVVFSPYKRWVQSNRTYVDSAVDYARLSWNGTCLMYLTTSSTSQLVSEGKATYHLMRLKMNDDGRTFSSAGEVLTKTSNVSCYDRFAISDDGNTVVASEPLNSFTYLRGSFQTNVTYRVEDFEILSVVDMSPDGKYVYGNLYTPKGNQSSFVWSVENGFRLIDRGLIAYALYSQNSKSYGCVKDDTSYPSKKMYWSQDSGTSISMYQYLNQLDSAYTYSTISTAKMIAYARNGRVFWFATGNGASYGTVLLDTTAVAILSGSDERKPEIQGIVSDGVGVHVRYRAPSCWTNSTTPTTTLERRDSLSSGQWLPVAAISGANTWSDFLETGIRSRPQSFYRITTR